MGNNQNKENFACFLSNYEKSKMICLKWHEQYGSKLDDSFDASDVEDVEEYEQPCTCKDKEKKTKSTEKKFDWPRRGATGTSTLISVADTPIVMKLPPPVVKSKLYEVRRWTKHRGIEGCYSIPCPVERERVVGDLDAPAVSNTGPVGPKKS
ncbi:uncharacterized protein NPIL_680371 [Nephila pilipes]|uniref:Uncharacterized protein n=1 Tax=Nephila pilipes TaxID=299642 RepID=A0A8X6NKZ2_NEPPI|nr:uncharacterized protein NPIL_680371 [Nephila pilipes]